MLSRDRVRQGSSLGNRIDKKLLVSEPLVRPADTSIERPRVSEASGASAVLDDGIMQAQDAVSVW